MPLICVTQMGGRGLGGLIFFTSRVRELIEWVGGGVVINFQSTAEKSTPTKV